jgi:hypothetical protein
MIADWLASQGGDIDKLKNKLAKVALITTEGFADTLAIGRQNRRHLYRLDLVPKLAAPVPADRRLEVRERHAPGLDPRTRSGTPGGGRQSRNLPAHRRRHLPRPRTGGPGKALGGRVDHLGPPAVRRGSGGGGYGRPREIEKEKATE